jgi:hypothetical protein
MKKKDVEFLKRVAKVAPELLDADIEERRFEDALGEMLATPPVEPKARPTKRRKTRKP